MGFLENILKKGLEQLNEQYMNSQNEKKSEVKSETTSKREVSQSVSNESLHDRIRKVLRENYSEYEVRENVPAGEFGEKNDGMPYSFVLYHGGSVKLTIMVLNGRNDYKLKRVVNAHKASKNAGANCINIMSYLPSTYEYINQRIYDHL
ncbi:MAG: hypothetical protein II919_05655 [Lachnospiraceae bacterium]|nr:hypothetical protein [Lachnospiraceae bacterium]MBQ3665572.1 hypothetical protein [Lachnospiraceae bacterium]